MEELKRIRELIEDSDRYKKTCEIRNYILEIERKKEDIYENQNEWIEWSKNIVDWYDPTIEKEIPLLSEVDRETLTLYEELKSYVEGHRVDIHVGDENELMNELIELGLWNEKIKNNIIANKGSIQQLTMIPEHIREKYKIVWEIPMKHLIDMSADRGAFICQSQSLNLWLEDPTYNTLTSMHFYSWKKGLKTGIYYLRRKAKHQAQQFTVEPDKDDIGINYESTSDEICEMCSA